MYFEDIKKAFLDALAVVREHVANMPTAYNVDKVVEEIEKLMPIDNREAHCQETTELGKCREVDTCEECLLRKVISFVNEEKYNTCIDEILGGGE